MATSNASLPQADGLRLELLGTARLLRGGMPLHVLERKDAALLALLVIEGPTSRVRAAALIWPDSDARHAGNNLRQRLFRLKRTAGQDIVVGDRQLALAETIEHDLAAVADRPAADVALGSSELLGGIDFGDNGELGTWVQGAREQWRVARRQALAEAAQRLEAEGRLAQALELAERLVLEEPAAEHAHRRVMRLHYLRGDRAAALAAYERCTTLLQREINARPGGETRELAATIRASAAIEQRSTARPLPTSLRRPPRLVGRDALWQQLEQAARLEETVLLEGEPGAGKSRLLHDFATAQRWPPPAGARPGDEAIAYALATRWLEGLLARFPPPAEPGVRQELARLVPRLADPGQPPTGHLDAGRLQQALATVLDAWCSAPAGGEGAHESVPGGVGSGLEGGVGNGVGSAKGNGVAVGVAADGNADIAIGMALDDLQFADTASLELLLGLAAGRPPSAARCTWVLAFRAGAQPDALRQWLKDADHHRAVPLRLAPLAGPTLADFLNSLELPGLNSAVWVAPLEAYCGGYPFAVIDTLAELHARGMHDFSAGPQLPAHSSQRLGAVVRRLEQLPADAQQLAHVAAAAGQDFSVELAAHVLACPPVALASPWRALENAGLFRSGGFAHDLVRQAALEALPQAIERTLHWQIAQWMARPADAADPAPAGHIAAHWEAAQEWAPAAQCNEAAAREARLRSARHEELHSLDAAARCHRAAQTPAGAAAAFDADWRSVGLLLALESADAALTRAQALVEAADGHAQRAAALVARAKVHTERWQADAGLADAREALQSARAAASPRLLSLAAQQGASALGRLGRHAEAAAMLKPHADGLLLHLDDDERLLWLSDLATTLDYADRRVEAVAVFDHVIAQAEALGNWGAASEAWGNQAIALMYLNRMQASLVASERAIECGRRAGSERGNVAIDEMSLAGSLRDLGCFDAYLKLAEPLPQALRDAGYALWAFNAENDLAICFAWLGRPELAQRVLSQVPDDMVPMMRAARLFTRARLARWRIAGDGASAAGRERPADLVQQALALVRDAGDSGRSYVRLKIALEAVRDDESAAALAALERIETEAREREQAMLAAHALMLRAELLTQRADADSAGRAGAALVQACLRDGAPPALYAPEVWWVAHRALATSDPALARQALQRAHAWIHTVAMPNVPVLFQRSFLERNPVNAKIVAAAARQGLVAGTA